MVGRKRKMEKAASLSGQARLWTKTYKNITYKNIEHFPNAFIFVNLRPSEVKGKKTHNYMLNVK